MGLRQTLASALGAPAAAMLDALIGRTIEATLDARGLVREAEMQSVRGQVSKLHSELGKREADIAALQQALAAVSGDLDDELDLFDSTDLEAAVKDLESRRKELAKRLERTHGAVQATQDRLQGLQAKVDGAVQQAGQAQQVATSAQATAEAAVEGVTGLESRLTN